ncbi:hypothetical protein Pylas_063 [Klebsiella phage Pylas]|uniref:Uncharacterized protein n=1 Tax=Klebsiella phage Pylas TaxID=2419682 RepID=A0A3G3BYL8_9CAUD|nr:hypothetical protein HYP73_gp63 [Klebsiella phage Pylas]AYP69317.1 hypothetical protein Pylas_063 [Klebsiella phage Pylas]
MFTLWFLIGLCVTLYILYIRDGNKVNEKRSKLRECFDDDGVYCAILIPAYLTWLCIFAVFWPLVVYAVYFYKGKDKV